MVLHARNWFGQSRGSRALNRRRWPSINSVHVHHQLTVTVIEETTRDALTWLRLQFRNGGNRAVTVTGATPFLGMTRAAVASSPALGAGSHVWPPAVADADSDHLPLVIQPGETRTYSIFVHYRHEHTVRPQHQDGDCRQIDYCLRVESQDSHGEPRMSSFKYRTLGSAAPAAAAIVRRFPTTEGYSALALREA